MQYSASGDPDPDCLRGHGDITEVTAKVCRTNPLLSILDYREGIEAPCLFPFTLNGRSYNSCFTDEIEDSGQLDYIFNTDGPVYGPNGELELDPGNQGCLFDIFTRPVFATCKNNCPGGRINFYIK